VSGRTTVSDAKSIRCDNATSVIESRRRHGVASRGCGPQILRTRSSCRVSLKPVLVMEAAQDWRCRDSAACWNRAAV